MELAFILTPTKCKPEANLDLVTLVSSSSRLSQDSLVLNRSCVTWHLRIRVRLKVKWETWWLKLQVFRKECTKFVTWWMSTINNKNKDLTTERRVYPQVRYSSLRYFPFFLIHHREYCSFDWINLGTFCWCSIFSCCNLVHGGWSRWSGWTSCTKSCGTGSQERFRGCTNPRPKHGGRLCTGQTRDKRNCNKKQCPGKIQMWLH